MRNKKLIVIFSIICCLTLLIVLNSVIFSVQHFDVYCYNADDESLDARVLEAHGVKKGKSIFILNEDKIISRIEDALPEVRVINVERKFPNRLSINYAKIYPYLELHENGKYYVCSNDGKIMSVSDEPSADGLLIKLKMKGQLTSTEVGDVFASSDSYEYQVVTNVLSALERLGYKQEAIDLFEFIDITKRDFIYLKTRSGGGIELMGTDRTPDKLRGALTLYSKEDAYKLTGTIKAFYSYPDKQIFAAYDPTSDYYENSYLTQKS